MKAIIFCFVLLALMGSQGYGQENAIVITESTVNYEKASKGLSIQRFVFDTPKLLAKYDYKVDLTGTKTVDDIFGIFWKGAVKTKTTSLDIGFIKKGDWKFNDEFFLDLTFTKSWDDATVMVDVGRGVKSDNKPRDFAIARFTKAPFLIEAAVVSKPGYENLSELAYEKYYWAALFSKYTFVSLGRELSRTWASLGIKGLKHFGNFTFANYDSDNGNYWLRTQFGVDEVNQNYFNTQNFIDGMGYLYVPPFFYKRFGPICTKGNYGFKFDGIKTELMEKYEIIASRKIGAFGYIAMGWQREVPDRNGIIIEYYKNVTMNMFNASLELKYEQNYGRISGFLVTSYKF